MLHDLVVHLAAHGGPELAHATLEAESPDLNFAMRPVHELLASEAELLIGLSGGRGRHHEISIIDGAGETRFSSC